MIYIILHIVIAAFSIWVVHGHQGILTTDAAKPLDRAGFTTNIILTILHIPMSYISLVQTFIVALDMKKDYFLSGFFISQGFVFPFIGLFSICMSVFWRNRGKSIWSFLVQFLPLVIFAVNLLLFYYAESLRVFI